MKEPPLTLYRTNICDIILYNLCPKLSNHVAYVVASIINLVTLVSRFSAEGCVHIIRRKNGIMLPLHYILASILAIDKLNQLLNDTWELR